MRIEQEIVSWLHGRPDWQQEAVIRILANKDLSVKDFEELTALCKTAEGQKKTKSRLFSGFEGHDSQNQTLRIVSIGEIEGIENLQPRKPIIFGEGNPNVVYGYNGSGKSGYVRIIQAACGKQDVKELRPNVFGTTPAKRCCKLEYEIGGLKATKEWKANEFALPEFAAIDIFDSASGRLYLSKESEVSYIPRSVAIFEDLVRVCEGVKQRLQQQKNTLYSKLPKMPSEYINTQTAKLYGNLKATYTESELAAILTWDEEDQKKLNALEERLKTDPSRLVIEKRNRKAQVDGILGKLTSALSVFSSVSCRKFLDLKSSAQKKRQIATEGATKALKSACLDGVGSDTWRALWEAARRYSEEKAYPVITFPNIADGARCVLCGQPLLEKAQQRFSEFEEYVKGEIESAACVAEAAYSEAVKLLPPVENDDALRTACRASGLNEEEWLPRLSAFWKTTAVIRQQLLSLLLDGIVGLKRDAHPWIDVLKVRSSDLEIQATQHDTDSKSFNRVKAVQDKTELQAKQWTAQQAESIKAELPRLKTIAQYDYWIRGTNHTAISKKASTIAERVITGAFIDRFNKELNKLGAKRIKVELVKARVSRGKALHCIKLRGVTDNRVSPIDILSDGEKRIVELAAFLADVMGRSSKAPFIFDDPISSLDQEFEEKTIDRLIELSADRQVIVFTHRLSFLGILCDKAAADTVCIRNEPWGCGEPGDIPIFGKRPDKALKKLHDERLAQAKKIFQDLGSEAYYPHAKSICTDLRIIVERIVELVLLADVIQRHRRAVNTIGKIGSLCKIRKEDCDLIDSFMTKYSAYEHSQSAEAPIDVPEPEEIAIDIKTLLKWHDGYKKHTVNTKA